jgi:hypothetical protein
VIFRLVPKVLLRLARESAQLRQSSVVMRKPMCHTDSRARFHQNRSDRSSRQFSPHPPRGIPADGGWRESSAGRARVLTGQAGWRTAALPGWHRGSTERPGRAPEAGTRLSLVMFMPLRPG